MPTLPEVRYKGFLVVFVIFRSERSQKREIRYDPFKFFFKIVKGFTLFSCLTLRHDEVDETQDAL